MQLVTRVICVVAVLVAVATTLTGCISNADSRAKLDLVETYTTTKNPDWPYLDATDQTAKICGQIIDCAQAVGNDYLVLIKFNSLEAAKNYVAQASRDTHQIDPIVIEFKPVTLTVGVKHEIINAVEQVNAYNPD